MSRIAMVILY